MKRIVSLITALVLFITSAAVFPAYAAENSHVIINQAYGASDNGYADHSFIGSRRRPKRLARAVPFIQGGRSCRQRAGDPGAGLYAGPDQR